MLDEDTPRQAADAYGASKREAEDLVLNWAARRGAKAAILRLPLVAGPGAPGNLAAMVRAIRAGRYMGIGRGEARRSMVRAEDVADIAPAAARTGGAYHLTDGCHPSFREIESAISAALGQRPPRRLPAPAARVAAAAGDALGVLLPRAWPLNSRVLRKMTSTLTFSDARARTLLGWNPTPVLERIAEVVG
jgi:nucleoside-diphosphate-sugar epimerase